MSGSSKTAAPPFTTAPNGLPLLRAPALNGVVHGFTTRIGGVSEAPYATLNLGRGTGDAPQRILTNRLRTFEALGCDPAGHVEAAQVHGRGVALVSRTHRGAKLEGVDALLTDQAGIVLAVHAADCVPILLWDPRHNVVGAIHAGWRGTAAGVVAAAVEAMVARSGSEPTDLRVAMGPAVGPCHYEVGQEVADAFATWAWADAVLSRGVGGAFHLDLVAANRRALLDLGVREDRIWDSGLCTACRADLCFSYRRDGVTGRQAALISLG